MKRRDLLKVLTGATAALGTAAASVKADVIEADPRTVLFVFTTPQHISQDAVLRIAETFKGTVQGTPYADCRAIVLGGGMTLQALSLRELGTLQRDIAENRHSIRTAMRKDLA